MISSLKIKLLSLVDSTLPESTLKSSDLEAKFKGRLVASMVIVATATVPFIAFIVSEIPEEKIVTTYICASGFVLIFTLMRFFKIPIKLASALLILNALIPICISIYNDNLYNTSLRHWLFVIPLLAVLLLGLRLGAFFTLLTVGLNYTLFEFSQKTGLGFPSFWNEASYIKHALVNQTGSLFICYFGVSIFEIMRLKNERALKRAQLQVSKREIELNQAKSLAHNQAVVAQISAGVAHEINSPLMIISGASEMLSKTIQKGKYTDKVGNYCAKTIGNSTYRISQIIKDFRVFSEGLSEKTRSNFQIEDLIKDLDERFQASFGKNDIKFNWTVGTENRNILAEEDGIRQVLSHLVQNSIDALELTQIKSIHLKVMNDIKTGKVKITISDTGPGIPTGIEDRVFTPFFTTKPVGAGAGLGLSISHGIVKDHGGSIYIDRNQSFQSAITFTIDQPAA